MNRDPEQTDSSMKRENVQAIYPLLAGQEAFLVAHRHSETDPGCLQASCRIRGSLDVARFQRALRRLVARHEMLRSTIKIREGKSPLMIVWKHLDVSATVHDFTDGAGKGASLAKLQNARLVEGVNIAQPVPYRFDLCRTGNDEHLLVWTFHHIFLDGWSTSVALRDLVALYHADNDPSRAPLPLLNTYADLVAARNALQQRDQLEYWKEKLEGYSGIQRHFASLSGFGGGAANFRSIDTVLNEDVTANLNRVARENQLTVSSIASTLWSLVLSKLYDQQDVAFASTVSGRSLPVEGMQDMTGMFTNVIPRRTEFHREDSLQQLMAAARDEQFEAQAHELVPLEEIESTCRLQRDRVLFETLLVIENFPVFDGGEELSVEGFESGLTSVFPVTMCVLPGRKWKFRCFFESSSCPEEVVKTILENMIVAAQKFAGCPATTAGEVLDKFAEIERQAGSEPVSQTRDRDIHDLVQVDDGEPKDNTQLKLAAIWERVLGKHGIRIDDDFFDVGGRSLTAVRLLSAVEEEFGIAFTPKTLIEYGTIEKLANLIQTDEKDAEETLIRFNDVESGEPLVCVHCGGEQAMYYRHLAAHFNDRPVIGIQSRGFRDGKVFTSFSRHASYSLELLRSMFGDRPLHFVGYCAGATLALEMVHQMESQNRKVGSFTVVDSPVIRKNARRFQHLLRTHNSVARASAGWLTYKLKRLIRRVVPDPRDIRDRWFGDSTSRAEYFHRRVTARTMAAFLAYRPKTFDTPVTLIRSTDFVSQPRFDNHLQWQDYARGGFEVRVTEADHYTILLEPEVGEVAAIVREKVGGGNHTSP